MSRRSSIHWSTLQAWIDGQPVGRPAQLHDLAHAFTIPQDPDYTTDNILAELQAAAGLPVGAGIDWILPDDYLLLDTYDRDAIEQLITRWANSKLTAAGMSRPYGRVKRPKPVVNGGGGHGEAGPDSGAAPTGQQ